MKLKCYAKINWALDVVGKRQDGYHDVDSLLQSVDVYDTLQVELHTEDILYGYGHEEPILDLYNDLCFKAVKEFRKQTSIQDKFCIKLNKNIPIGAGMGGGSADAAGVLYALNSLTQSDLPMDRLQDIGKRIGADVPFMLAGGSARVQGIGEVVTPIQPIPSYPMLIVFDDIPVSTKEVFQNVSLSNKRIDMDRVMQCLQNRQLSALRGYPLNALLDSAVQLKPEIRNIIEELYDHGALLSNMTGTGSAVFALFEDQASLDSARKALEIHRKCCMLAKPVPQGLELLPEEYPV